MAFAKTQLHAAYAAITNGLADKWNYLSCTTPDIGEHLDQLETTLRMKVIPSLTGRPPPSDAEYTLLTLPASLRGIGVCDLSKRSSDEFTACLQITSPLKSLISEMYPTYSLEARDQQLKAKKEVHRLRRSQQYDAAGHHKRSLSSTLQRSMALAEERGASSWLTVLPVAELGFILHKSDFHDTLCLRYGWLPSCIPIEC